MVLSTGINKIKTAVFISGTGSNLKSLIKFSKSKKSPISINLIISNNPKAKGLNYAKKFNLSLVDFRAEIHLVSLARNLRILGNWVNLYRSGKTQYLKKYRKNTWLQILKHVEHLRFWDLRELFEEIYNKTK